MIFLLCYCNTKYVFNLTLAAILNIAARVNLGKAFLLTSIIYYHLSFRCSADYLYMEVYLKCFYLVAINNVQVECLIFYKHLKQGNLSQSN